MSGPPERVYAAAGRCHRQSGRYHIVNSGCDVSPLTPSETFRALNAYAREHKPEE